MKETNAKDGRYCVLFCVRGERREEENQKWESRSNVSLNCKVVLWIVQIYFINKQIIFYNFFNYPFFFFSKIVQSVIKTTNHKVFNLILYEKEAGLKIEEKELLT